MINKSISLVFILFFLLTGCSSGSDDSSSVSGTPAGEDSNGSENQNPAGKVTAGEWNDLDNWVFWENLIGTNDYKNMPEYWSFYHNNRIDVNVVTTNETPIIDAVVKLKRDGVTIFTSRTDNKGNAKLWSDVFQKNTDTDFSKFTIDINNGTSVVTTVKPFKEGVNQVIMQDTTVEDKIEISFVVDATGSMGDELEFLKTELLDVISRIETANPNSEVYTSSVFYRDEGDAYLVKTSNFTNNINTTLNFIKDQSAGGGGDYPEAVHSALNSAVNELQWSTSAKTRILFLILDAPPHYTPSVINNMQASILKASEKGIKIIPITASGINKETEFLMRFFAMSTNGTYVFITDDSGIGNSHLQASVGEYQVELLNDLMVRLINKYAE